MSDMVAEDGDDEGYSEYTIADYVGQEVMGWNFVDNFNWGDHADMTFDIDGVMYRITVENILQRK